MRAESTDDCIDYAEWLCTDCDTDRCRSYKKPEDVKVELEVNTYKQLTLFDL